MLSIPGPQKAYTTDLICLNWHSNPVLTAVYEKDLPVFRNLVTGFGFDINELITGGWTCLQVACYFNRIDFVREISQNEETNISAASPESRLQTSLHIACNRGHSEIVRILIANYPKKQRAYERRTGG